MVLELPSWFDEYSIGLIESLVEWCRKMSMSWKFKHHFNCIFRCFSHRNFIAIFLHRGKLLWLDHTCTYPLRKLNYNWVWAVGKNCCHPSKSNWQINSRSFTPLTSFCWLFMRIYLRNAVQLIETVNFGIETHYSVATLDLLLTFLDYFFFKI